jgi:Skp family chaperone for outer membrane proteins
MFLGCLAGVVILAMVYEYSEAQPKTGATSSKIGIVSIMKIFRNCKRSAVYRDEMNAEQNRIRAELQKLSKEIEAQEEGLKAFKQDSSEYLAQRKELIDKRASLEAQQAFNKEQIILKQYGFSKELYQDILQITSELAEQKGLDVVLEKDEIDILALSVNEIEQTIRTHKVLYNGGCVDISDEVLARLDKK